MTVVPFPAPLVPSRNLRECLQQRNTSWKHSHLLEITLTIKRKV